MRAHLGQHAVARLGHALTHLGLVLLAVPILWRALHLLRPHLRCHFFAPRQLENRHDVARCGTQTRIVSVPLAQPPNNLLLRPVLEFVAPPRKLGGFDPLVLMRLKICAENNLNLRSNLGSVIV